MSRTQKKYIPKWKRSKFYHDKLMVELAEKKNEPQEIEEKSEEQQQKELLEMFNNDNWLYDNMLISYEELQKRKNGSLQSKK